MARLLGILIGTIAILAGVSGCSAGPFVPDSWDVHRVHNPVNGAYQFNPGGYEYEIKVPGGSEKTEESAASWEGKNKVDQFRHIGPDGESVLFIVAASYYPPSVFGREVSIDDYMDSAHEILRGRSDYWKVVATARPSVMQAREEVRFVLKGHPDRPTHQITTVRQVEDWFFQVMAVVDEPWAAVHRETIDAVLESFTVRLTG